MRSLFFAMILAPLMLTAQDGNIVVSKDARTSNPTLKVEAWKGDPTVMRLVKEDLIYSDWFTLTDKAKADYTLTGEAATTGSIVSLTLRLKGPKGESGVSLKHNRVRWMVHAAVDKLIQDTFNNPGFCSTQIAYVKTAGKQKEIYLSEFDGSNSRAFTKNGSISTEPAWGAKNRFLTYTLYKSTSTDIIIVDLQQIRHKNLASYRGLNAGCALARNRQMAAMTLSKGGKQVDLFIKDLRTDKLIALTNDDFVEASPCWSPDDKYICFVGSKSRRPTLFVIPSLGGAPKRVANLLSEAVSPDWSAVSNKICYASLKGGKYTIAEIDMSKAERKERVLVSAAGDWEAPSWTADGRHIVCSRKLNGKTSLYLIDSWYGKMRELKAGNGVALPACSSRY